MHDVGTGLRAVGTGARRLTPINNDIGDNPELASNPPLVTQQALLYTQHQSRLCRDRARTTTRPP